MNKTTILRRTLRFIMWGFDKRLHKARFAAFDEKGSILASEPPPHSLLLGVNVLKQFYVVRPIQTRRELGNVLVVAPTRGGKGLLATTQLFTWGGSVIVNDLKGDLFKYTAGYRATLGDVYVINPIKGIGHRYDPLSSYKTEHELFLACHKLLYEKSEADPFWTDSAIQMLTQIFAAARRENQPLFPYARKIVRLGLPDAAQYLHTLSPDIATQFLGRSFSSVDFENARRLDSTWTTLTSKLQYFLSEIVVKSLAVSDFTVSDLMLGEKPVTIYLQWLNAISKPYHLLSGLLSEV